LRNTQPKSNGIKKTIRQKYVRKQSKIESQRNVAYIKHKKNAIDINITVMLCYDNTDDGGQAMGEEMKHVQMSR